MGDLSCKHLLSHNLLSKTEEEEKDDCPWPTSPIDQQTCTKERQQPKCYWLETRLPSISGEFTMVHNAMDLTVRNKRKEVCKAHVKGVQQSYTTL